MESNQTMSIEECADFLKVSSLTVLRLAKSGKLPAAKIGRKWVFTTELVLEWLKTETMPCAKAKPKEKKVGGKPRRVVAI